MRYIVDTSGYVKSVSFGGMVICGGSSCAEYTGAIPSGYESLEEWYLTEGEQLYRWKVVNGNLTFDSEAAVPCAAPAYARKDFVTKATLSATGWSQNGGGWHAQSIAIDGSKADSVIDISLPASATAEQAKAFMQLGLQSGEQSDGAFVLRAFGKVNTVDIPVDVVIRDYGAGVESTGAAVNFVNGSLRLL